jgi:putative acetyltransferase
VKSVPLPEGARQPDPARIRPVRDDDATALITLVGAAFAEHPGCVLDLDDLDRDLLAPATSAARSGGRWWVVSDPDAGVVATIGAGPPADDGLVELKRLYVAGIARGRGLGAGLVGWVETHAAGLGADQLHLWSDTRFDTAHRLYRRLGHRPTGERRHLDDPSDTTELRFLRDLTPTPPRRTVTWDGPYGPDTSRLTDLPDGARLDGEVAGVRYDVEVDGAWAVRRVEVLDGRTRHRLSSDGAGRWWRDGTACPELDGARSVDLALTPAITTLLLRRGDAEGPHTVARIRDDLGIELATLRLERLSRGRWRAHGDDRAVELRVDDDLLVVHASTPGAPT